MFAPLYMRLNGLLATHCTETYSDPTGELAILLCVSGRMSQFRFEGCDRIRRSRKHREIGMDIGIPEARWRDVPEPEIRAYLMDSVDQAVELFIKRLEKDKEPVRADDLRADLAKVRSEFLGLPLECGGSPERGAAAADDPAGVASEAELLTGDDATPEKAKSKKKTKTKKKAKKRR